MSEVVINTTDQIVVTRLRSMSELEEEMGGEILVYSHSSGGFEHVIYEEGLLRSGFDGLIDLNDAHGWIPFPVYREPSNED